jgi:hypothetical protein
MAPQAQAQSKGGATRHHPDHRQAKLPKGHTVANTSAKRGRNAVTNNAPMHTFDQSPWPKEPTATVAEITTPPDRETDARWLPASVDTVWNHPLNEPVVLPIRHTSPPHPLQRDPQRRGSSLERSAMPLHPGHHMEHVYSPFSPPCTTENSDEDHTKSLTPSTRSSSSTPPNVPESVKTTLYNALGAGRLDPFHVYGKKDLPLYVHEVLDHYLYSVSCSFTLAAEGVGQAAVMSHIMGHAMSDPLTWYTIILSGVTYFMFLQGDKIADTQIPMLRLSYKTQAMALIRENIARDPNNVSEGTLFAINTLASHGGAIFEKGFKRDRLQDGKSFGAANNLDYYTSIEIEWEHWNMFTRLMRRRGGPATLSHPPGIPGFPPSPGPGCLTTTDTMIAWRSLQCPEFPLVYSTEHVMKVDPFKNDAMGVALSQKLLSGFPTMPKSSMHFKRLTAFLKNVRKLVVDFEQHQRGEAPTLDLRKLYWTRMMLMHDLLLLPDLEMSDNPLDLLYELCRNCMLAFMQLVLCPVAARVKLPEKILKQLVPVLHRSTVAIHGRTLDREHPSLFLWAVLLGGMLAMEHYQTQNDSALLDEVSALIDRLPIKAEKSSWPMALRVAQTFLWLESDCEPAGRRYWNYACLWLAENRRDAAVAAI